LFLFQREQGLPFFSFCFLYLICIFRVETRFVMPTAALDEPWYVS
jgi:hypothetical protein